VTPWLHPGVPLLLGAALAAVAPAGVRRAASLAGALAALALALVLPPGAAADATLFGLRLALVRADALAQPFGIVFALIASLCAIYGWSGSRRYHVASGVAASAALGVVYAGDWPSFYAAWELLAVASFALVLDGGSERCRGAAYRYLLFHAFGGVCLLSGVALSGASAVGPLGAGPGSALVALAFLVNAALPPLHAWLVDAYPESSPAGAVVLSAFATKSAVYALARTCPGLELLVWLGVAMALYGVVLAVIENDLRRLLAYHIVSQVGYMVAGVGLGSDLALAGAVAHAFCHILYKGLLFMAAGAVIAAVGRRSLADLGGLRGALPWVLLMYMVGALSISGAPLLSGFVSKSLIVAAAEADHRVAVVALLSLASIGTFLSVALKLPALAFGGPIQPQPVAAVPRSFYVAMTLAALLCVGIGVAPSTFYVLLPHRVDYDPYDLAHTLEVLQVMAGTVVVFVALRSWLAAKHAVTLDFDLLYRALGREVAGLAASLARAADALERAAGDALSHDPSAPARAPSPPVAYALLAAALAFGGIVAVLLA
jgi:multicomponent Na+:H+ antiporter subunit D